jgi:hypothetical protein
MPELDRGHGAEILEEGSNAAIAAHVDVSIKPGAMVGAAAARLDRGLLAAHDPGAADRKLSEMDEVPVGHIAVDREILRHRAKHDPVLRGDAAHADRPKQQRALIDGRAQSARAIGDDLDAGDFHLRLHSDVAWVEVRP